MIIGELLATLGIDISEFQEGMDDAGETAETGGSKIVSGLSAVGGATVTAALAVGAAAIAGVTTTLIGAVTSTTDWAEKLDSIGDVLGTSSEESAALAVAIEGVGGNTDALTGQMAFLTKGLLDAEGNLGNTGQVLNDLGISFLDAEGNMLPATDIIQAVADTVGTMPDGLEKTALMTKLFGKSGKDLSDTLGALADGGLADADAKAKALGLSMSEDATNAAIGLGRQVNTLKLGMTGAFVTIGTTVMPIISQVAAMFIAWLSSPEVQTGITQLATFIGNLAMSVVNAIPVVISWVTQIYDYLRNNQGIIIGILVALGVAVATFVYTTVIPAAIATITAMAPIVLPIIAIAAAVALLYQAWTTDFGGIRTTLTDIWEGTLSPIFNNLVSWLQANIPTAIQWLSDTWNFVLLPAITLVWDWVQTTLFPMFTELLTWLSATLTTALQSLSDFWTLTLYPAIEGVWAFIQDSIIPLFTALAELFNVAMNLALTALAGLWQNVLLPALTDIYNYISSTLQPVFQTLSDFFSNTIGPIIDSFVSGALAGLQGAMDGISAAFSTVIGWIQDMIDKLSSITLPDWLQPGSPTPFEYGLRGISDALNSLSRHSLPDFSANLNLMPIGAQTFSTSPMVGSKSYSNVYHLHGVKDSDSMLNKIKVLDMIRSG